MQLFVESDPSEHFFTLRDTRLDDFATKSHTSRPIPNGLLKPGFSTNPDLRTLALRVQCLNAPTIVRTL